MTYPTISRAQVESFVGAVNAAKSQKARSAVVAPRHADRGTGKDIVNLIVGACEAVLSSMPKALRTTNADSSEGELSVQFYKAFSQLNPEVLNDLDFWRYVACEHLKDFIIWRDGSADSPASRAGFGAGKSASGFQDCVPYRMFRRGQIACLAKIPGVTPLQIAKIPGTDLWRSHVLRVRIGNAPTAAATFLLIADGYRGGSVSITKLSREAAKLVKRLRSNVLMDYLDWDDAREMLEPEFKAAAKIIRYEQDSGDVANNPAKAKPARAKSPKKSGRRNAAK